MSSGDGVPRGTVTFLFADIEGSTRLWEEQPEFMTQALAVLDRLVRSAVDDFGGYVFATGGDSYAVAFETAQDAVGSALAIQQSIGTEFAGSPRLSLRMGVHSGEADERAGDYFGPPVNRAARIMSAGHGGQVLISGATYDLVGANLPKEASFIDLGEHRLRDISRLERLFQLTHPGLATEFAPIETRQRARNNLPIQPNEIVGRDDDLEKIRQLVRGTRLVTLSGPGGAGKTRLALEVGRSMLEEFRDGVWLVELAQIQDPGLLPDALAAAMEIRNRLPRTSTELIVEVLARRATMLIFDNSEHLIRELAELADLILGASPSVHLLVTGRERLHIRGESVYSVSTLSLPDPRQTTPTEIGSAAAVSLFVERVREVEPDFALDEGNAGFVAQICVRLDGLPLALELAAARMLLFDPEQLLGRLDDRFRLVAGGGPDRMAHHRTLQAALEWSYDLLDATEQVLLNRLAVFSGPFDLAYVESICVGGHLDQASVASGMYALVDKSLISIQTDRNGKRFVFLETVKAFVSANLRESGEDPEFRRRHAEYFADLVDESFDGMWGRDEVSWLDRLERDYLNLRQAVTWSFDHERHDLAIRIAGSLTWFAYRRHHNREVGDWMRRALEQEAPDSSPAAVARLLLGVGASSSDFAEAIRLLDRAVMLADELGLDDEAMAARHTRAEAFARSGDVEAAIRMEEADLEMYRASDFYKGLALSASTLSDLIADDDPERSVALASESIAAAKRWQSPRIELYGWSSLLKSSLRLGNLDGALRALKELQKIENRSQLGREIPGYLSSFAADIAIAGDDYEVAANHVFIALCEFADAARATGGDIDGGIVASYLLQLGTIALHRGGVEQGVILMAAASTVSDSMPGEGTWLFERSRASLDSARKEITATAYETAWEAGRAMTEESSVAFALSWFDQAGEAADTSFDLLSGD